MRLPWALLLPITLAAWAGVPTASEHAGKGLDLAQAGDLKGAESELRRAVSLSPANPEYLADLGSILGLEEKLDESIVCLEKVLKINPGDTKVRRDLAAGQWRTGRLQAAAANLELILKAKPGDPPSTLLLGMVRENLRDYAKAAALLGSVPDLVNQHPESISALARSLYNTGQPTQAKELLTVDLLRHADARGIYLGGGIAAQAGDSDTANSLFAEAAKLLTDETSRHPSSEALNLLAWCYYKQGKFPETIRAMDQAIALDSSRDSNYVSLGLMLADRQMLAVAASVAQEAVRKAPNSYRSHMLKGFVEAKQGDYAAAVASYNRAIELNPDSPEASFNLARTEWHAGMNAESEATFEQALKRFPQDALTHQEYALMLLNRAEKGDSAAEARAVVLLKKASALDPSLSEPHFQIGNLLLQQGKFAQSAQELEMAAKLNPKEAKAHFALSRACRRLGLSAKAAAELAIYQDLKSHEEKPLEEKPI